MLIQIHGIPAVSRLSRLIIKQNTGSVLKVGVLIIKQNTGSVPFFLFIAYNKLQQICYQPICYSILFIYEAVLQ